jgi:hypothetical protein
VPEGVDNEVSSANGSGYSWVESLRFATELDDSPGRQMLKCSIALDLWPDWL